MTGTIARQLKQKKFSSHEQEIFLGLLVAAARIVEPWAQFLKPTAELTNNLYNVLRILRGSHPSMMTCSDIGERMVARDPDMTRLADRLEKRGLVSRVRSSRDRRVVEVGITDQGLALVDWTPTCSACPKRGSGIWASPDRGSFEDCSKP